MEGSQVDSGSVASVAVGASLMTTALGLMISWDRNKAIEEMHEKIYNKIPKELKDEQIDQLMD